MSLMLAAIEPGTLSHTCLYLFLTSKLLVVFLITGHHIMNMGTHTSIGCGHVACMLCAQITICMQSVPVLVAVRAHP
jgi:hypothetical protein